MAVEEVVVHSRVPYDGATEVGAGPYELVSARAHFVLDPGAAANERITDLGLATRGDGLVRFSADLLVLEPVTGTPAPLLYVVANRGRAESVPLSFPAPGDAKAMAPAPGDGLLLRHGYRIAWCGWQCDLRDRPGQLRLDPPLATLGGETPPGFMELRFEPEPGTARACYPLIDTRTSALAVEPYPTRSIEDAEARLFERPRTGGGFTEVPRDGWAFATTRDGSLVPSATDVSLKGGFRTDRIYVLFYRPATCPVNGVGLTVARDVVSMLRYEPELALGAGSPTAACALGFGISQSGRYLRQFLFEGLNLDEDGRQVFDGVLAHIAGARRGEFNTRYGQLSINRGEGAGLHPPYAASHAEGGLLDRQRALGGSPKLMLLNSAFEYWRRDAAALHMAPDGTADLAADEEVRCYLLAGTSHVLGTTTLTEDGADGPANPPSVLDPMPAMRALLLALERWVVSGAEPPASAVPSLVGASAWEREQALGVLATIPGLALPDPAMIPATSRSHPGDEEWWAAGVVEAHDRVVGLVAAVDADGNETAGIRLPELAAPLYTHLGFNPRDRPAGEPAELFDLIGSSLPFPTSVAARAAAGDPRPSVEERYSSQVAYLALVGKAVRDLDSAGYLLAADEGAIIGRAAQHYDEVMAGMA